MSFKIKNNDLLVVGSKMPKLNLQRKGKIKRNKLQFSVIVLTYKLVNEERKITETYLGKHREWRMREKRKFSKAPKRNNSREVIPKGKSKHKNSKNPKTIIGFLLKIKASFP